MSKPYFTALIGTYNQGRFVEAAIESALAQDYPAELTEVLVIDDGSADGTTDRIQRFGERIRYIRKENGGQASVLNRGFLEARGAVVVPLDGDDVWKVEKLRRVAEEFAKHPEAGLVCHPYEYWVDREDRREPDRGFCAMEGSIWDSPRRILAYGRFGTCGMAFRVETLRKMLPIPETLVVYADTFLVNIAPFITSIVAINEHLTSYRQHEANNTAFAVPDPDRAQRRWLHYKMAVDEVRKWLREHQFDLAVPGYAAFFERHDLVTREFRFQVNSPGRLEFGSYLGRLNRLYRPLWTRRYSMLRSLLALSGLILGYRAYEGIRRSYRESSNLQRLREGIAPVRAANAALEREASSERLVS